MKWLRKTMAFLWDVLKGSFRQFALYGLPPAVAAVALIYVSSQVFGFSVESRHSSWFNEDGNTCEGWLIFMKGQEGVRWETRTPKGQLVSAGHLLIPAGSFFSPSTMLDRVNESEEFTFFPNGQLESETQLRRVDDKETTECTFFDESGNRLAVTHRVDSLPHGVCRKWHPNGQLMFEQNFSTGLPKGIGRIWNESGLLIGEAHSQDGFAYDGVFPRHAGPTIGWLTVWQDGQQVEEISFEPDMPPVHWDIPECRPTFESAKPKTGSPAEKER